MITTITSWTKVKRPDSGSILRIKSWLFAITPIASFWYLTSQCNWISLPVDENNTTTPTGGVHKVALVEEFIKAGVEVSLKCWLKMAWIARIGTGWFFWLVLPNFSAKKKNVVQPMRIFCTSRISWNRISDWLPTVFHFGTVKKTTLYKYSIIWQIEGLC